MVNGTGTSKFHRQLQRKWSQWSGSTAAGQQSAKGEDRFCCSLTDFLTHFRLSQSLGVTSHADRALLKKRLRDMKCEVEKERKALEKELKAREKMKQRDNKNKK